ncbi:MAG: hypothetical protein Kow006_08410 [Gammaproteobacteria bacterium]
MSHSPRFQLVFLGIEGEGIERAVIKEALRQRFRLSSAAIQRLVSTQPVVIKQNLDGETAVRYKRIVDSLGGITRIELMPHNNRREGGIMVERRKHNRRLILDRRSPLRIRAIDTNRRRNKGRRSSDYVRAS